MDKIPEGVCLKCRAPLLIDTSLAKGMVFLCPECEKELNQNVAASMARRGKDTKNKRVIFPTKASE